jgi:DNA-binding CsgD family transcriptional regulator
MKKTILIYGAILAFLIFTLEYIEYRFMVLNISFEILVLFIAIIFVVLGWWLGQHLTRKPIYTVTFQKNIKAIEYLRLSERELEVLELVAAGLSNKEIAGKLYVSINTVKTHLQKVFEKLGVNRRTQAVEKAKSLHLIR